MKLVDSNEIKKVFKLLNENKLDYILLRNINNEIPLNLKIGKDIDILIKDKKLINLLKKYNFQMISHPHRNNIYLYGVKKFVFMKNYRNNIIFDLHFQIAVRSLNAGEWIPLDQEIQKSAWENKRFEKVDKDFGYWTLSYNDEFITLIARSVFDKREFQPGYIKRIEELKSKIDLKDVEKKLKLVFFKYTPYLLEQIEKKEYKNIIKNYIQFKEY